MIKVMQMNMKVIIISGNIVSSMLEWVHGQLQGFRVVQFLVTRNDRSPHCTAIKGQLLHHTLLPVSICHLLCFLSTQVT